jgi:hypothetical protein
MTHPGSPDPKSTEQPSTDSPAGMAPVLEILRQLSALRLPLAEDQPGEETDPPPSPQT